MRISFKNACQCQQEMIESQEQFSMRIKG